LDRTELRGQGRGQFLQVEAKAEAKNNYEKVPNNDPIYPMCIGKVHGH